MVHMGLVGQYFSELDPNKNGPPQAADPAVQARKLVGMERRDVILTAVFGTLGALGLLLGLGLVSWLYLRSRRSKQHETDLEERRESPDAGQRPPPKKNGFLNLKTPLISIKAFGPLFLEQRGFRGSAHHQDKDIEGVGWAEERGSDARRGEEMPGSRAGGTTSASRTMRRTRTTRTLTTTQTRTCQRRVGGSSASPLSSLAQRS